MLLLTIFALAVAHVRSTPLLCYLVVFYQTSYFPSDLHVGGRTDKDNSLTFELKYRRLEIPWSQGGSNIIFYLSLVVSFYGIKKYPSQPKIQPN